MHRDRGDWGKVYRRTAETRGTECKCRSLAMQRHCCAENLFVLSKADPMSAVGAAYTTPANGIGSNADMSAPTGRLIDRRAR